IGGGIAGLAAAFELEQARQAGTAVTYTLFEAGDRLGGSLATEIVDGAVLERGPDSFLTEKPAATELCRELGLGADLVPSNDAARKTYIVVKNQLVALPDGLMFLVPTKLIPTAMTRLFSLPTKVRMGLELLRPPRRNGDADEAVATLVERHFGAEAVERLADPLLSGIYGGDATQLSARTVLPRLVEMEQEYGSLTRGMLAAHKQMRAKAKAAQSGAANGNGNGNGNGKASTNGRAPRSIFTTLRGGLQQLVDTLVARLDPACIRLATPVSGLARVEGRWSVISGGAAEFFDSVIVASPAWAAGVLLRPVDAELGEDLGAIPYSSSITVNLIYDEAKLGPLPDGFGFLVPGSEGRAMLACTFVHRKFLGRTPPGKAVLRAFLGGMKNEDLLAEPDAALIATVQRELREILGDRVLGPHVEPEHAQVSRWRRAMAQYAVGHQERMQRIATQVATLPGLRLVGNAYDGIGIPDCIRLGRRAAKELVGQLSAPRA
ncbi:MAG: protoporphyrinogen oxidase, partial [Terracidiphilus sp.]